MVVTESGEGGDGGGGVVVVLPEFLLQLLSKSINTNKQQYL